MMKMLMLEWRRMQRSLLLVMLLFWGLTALGLWSGWQFEKRQQENALQMQQKHTAFVSEQLQKTRKREKSLKAAHKPTQPDKKIYRNPAYLAQNGPPAILNNGPLNWLSIGQSPVLPQATKISLKDPALLETQDNLQHPLQLWTGFFDLSFVMIYLLPLFLILICFDLTASEQASGTLRLLLVQGGSLLPLISSKLLARVAVLGLMLTGAAGLVLLACQIGQLTVSPLRLLWAGALVFAYGLGWILLAALLNGLRWSASAVAAALAAGWLVWAWLVPAASQQVLQVLYPVPSRMSYIQAYREASEEARQKSARLLGRYLEDHPDLAGGADNRFAMLQLSKEEALAEAVAPLALAYQQQLQRQQQMASAVQLLSPVTLMEQSLMQLAGSDLQRYHDYRQQVSGFQQQWKAFFLPAIRQGQALNSSDFEAFPAFHYSEPRLRSLAAGLGGISLYLLGLLLLLGWQVRQRYRHYQVVD